MRILVVEDDPRIAGFLLQGLRETGYTVTCQNNGEDGYLDARYNHYDLLILDILLPDMNGVVVARRLRAEGVAVPILMLTALDAEADIIAGLDAGADDYLTKPFRFAELLARIRALMRRDTVNRSSLMCVGDLELDTAAQRVRIGGEEVPLSHREYDLLQYLMHNAGRIVPRDRLMEEVWGESEAESNVLEVYVGHLRHKIDAKHTVPLIQTVRGLGYRLRAS